MLIRGKVYLAMEDAASARGMYQEYLQDGENDAKAYQGRALCDIYERRSEEARANLNNGRARKDDDKAQRLQFDVIDAYEYEQSVESGQEKTAADWEQY